LYITNAPVSDVVLVFAVHPGKPKMAGISAFLVEKGTPGFTVTRSLDKMGLRTSPMGEVVLDECYVPAENRVGSEGAGMAIFNSSMAWERSCILASALGAMQRPAVTVDERFLTYAELDQLSNQVGRALLAQGVRQARAAPPARAEYRTVAGPGSGRGAGRGRASRQRGGDDLQRCPASRSGADPHHQSALPRAASQSPAGGRNPRPADWRPGSHGLRAPLG
jgi:hypothetical protein